MVTTTFDTGVHYLFLAKPYITLHCTGLRLHFCQIWVKDTKKNTEKNWLYNEDKENNDNK